MQRLSTMISAVPRRWLIVGSIALAVLGLGLVVLASRRPVTIVVDGEVRRSGTFARTVGGALNLAGLRLTPDDVTMPAADQPLPISGVIELRRARPVSIDVDGQISEVRSAAAAAENVLVEAGMRLYPGDRLWIDGFPAGALPSPVRVASRIRIERAFDLSLDDRGARRSFRSAAPTVGEALWESGIVLRAADALRPNAGAAMDGATGLRFTPSRRVEVVADGARLVSWAAGESVGETLANAGVPLVGLDYARPAASGAVPGSAPIEIVRVTETAAFEGEVLPFETRWEGSDEIEIDRQGLVDTGAAGLEGTRRRVRYEGGVETEALVEPQWTAVAPRDRIMGYGTKIVIRTLETPNGPLEYWRAVPMYATSYAPCKSAGVPGKCYYGTASGLKVAHGIAAMTVPNFLAMRGQRVYVPGYGTAQVADTGGGIPGRLWIDLAYTDDTYVSWHQWVTVYFLTPVPAVIDYILE